MSGDFFCDEELVEEKVGDIMPVRAIRNSVGQNCKCCPVIESPTPSPRAIRNSVGLNCECCSVIESPRPSPNDTTTTLPPPPLPDHNQHGMQNPQE